MANPPYRVRVSSNNCNVRVASGSSSPNCRVSVSGGNPYSIRVRTAAQGPQGPKGDTGDTGPAGANYTLPAATNSTLGGIIVGDNLTITANGLLSAQAGGVTTFNNRTGNVSLVTNDVYSAAFDASKAGTPQLYVRTSNIAPGFSNDLANTPNGTQQSLYSIRSAYPNAPLYSNGTIWSFGSVNIKTTTATNANAAASDVGVFEVIFQVTSNLPVFAGTTNKRSGFQLVYRSGSPWLNILGGVAYDSFVNINSYPDTYILTKGQAKLYFLTRDVADTLYEPLKRIEPPLELP